MKIIKKTAWIFIFCIISSCNTKNKSTIADIIDCDRTANYSSYFNALSDDYKILLKEDFKTTNNKVLFDSLQQSRISNYNAINDGRIKVENKILKEVKSSIPNVFLIKYRRTIYDVEQESTYYNDHLVLRIVESEDEKYFPYNKILFPKTDSILSNKYGPILLKEIELLLKRKKYTSGDKNYTNVKDRLSKYFMYIDTNNPLFVNMIYPPLFKLLCSNPDKKCLDEAKNKVAEMFINNVKYFKASDYEIESFEQIKSNRNIYILNYTNVYENHTYFLTKLIVVKEKDQFYFLEYSMENISLVADLFDEKTLKSIIETADRR